jgi:phosphate-selective porin
MAQRSWWLYPLLRKGDGGCFNRTHPNRQKSGAINLLQKKDRLVGGHLDSNADYLHWD